MANWEYMTLIYGTADRFGRRWIICSPAPETPGKQVGQAERGRFIGRIWQAAKLLETALREHDSEGWELVSTSFRRIDYPFVPGLLPNTRAATRNADP